MDKIHLNRAHCTDVKELSINDTTVTATAAEINELDASAVGGVIKIKTLPVTIVASTDEQDTGWNLPAKCAILDCWVDVTTKEDTGTHKTIDVGTLSGDSGTADGFLDGASVAAVGVIKGEGATTGSAGSKYWSGTTKGALLALYEVGSSDTDEGYFVPVPCVSPGSLSVSYTLPAIDYVELVANIVIMYVEIA
jgi:hypothetical protein